MLRLSEAALIAVPLAAFAIWALFVRDRFPAWALAAGFGLLALCAIFLVWFGVGESLAPGRPYVPAHLNAEGQVVGQ